MDKVPSQRALVSFIIISFCGLPIILMTLIVDIPWLYVMVFLHGFGGGGLENVGNVNSLIIWRGRDDGGPYVHAIHFGWSLGTVIGPLMAAPFLTERSEVGIEDLLLGDNFTLTKDDNSTEATWSTDPHAGTPKVVYLFILVGCIEMISGVGYLLMALKQCFSKKGHGDVVPKDKVKSEEQMVTWRLVVFVAIICAFYFLYVGVEVVLGTYLSTFAVKSKLQATKVDGAYLTAIFWGCFAAFRFLAIFLAIYLNPLATMILSFVLSLGSGIGLAIAAEDSLLVLQVLVAFMGCGTASIYATGLLWVEKYIVVTNKIGAAYAFCAMLGPDIFPILVGSFVVEHPMTLMYVVLTGVASCIVLFTMAALVGESMNQYEPVKRDETKDPAAIEVNDTTAT